MAKKKNKWTQYIGCCGWFNQKDGVFDLVSYAKSACVSSNEGPVWTVVGEEGVNLLISINMLSVSTLDKKFIRVFKPLLKDAKDNTNH